VDRGTEVQEAQGQEEEDLGNNQHKDLSSTILKFSLLATGIAGVVAEYILATLASYFLPDATVQWTMIISVMLFSMGIGSRLSRFLIHDLLDKFVWIEIALSILISFTASIVFVAAGRTVYYGIIIYALSICIGLLIGMEIPLVTRINEKYEELRLNIASVMSWDYIGSLIGGVFFVFIGIPYLGMTYTPYALGLVNLLVASIIIFKLSNSLKSKNTLRFAFLATFILIISGCVFSEKIILFGEQKRYKDKIIHIEQSRYQKIVITESKGYYWLFINGNQQLSSFDEWMYHEPLVQIPLALSNQKQKILIMGGGDGCAVRELLKHPEIEEITLVDLDPKMTILASTHPALLSMNQHSLSDKKVTIIHQDAFIYARESNKKYDLVIIDLPDPRTIDINKLYTKNFYGYINDLLADDGIVITQAGSPYFATKAFYCIEKTMQETGFYTLPIHNQVITMGEWGWVIGSKILNKVGMKKKLHQTDFSKKNHKWLNNESVALLTSFGKPMVDTSGIKVNTLARPCLPNYYLKGNWDLY